MQLWEAYLATLDKRLGKPTVDRWLRSLKLLRFDAANLYLQAENTFHISWFQEHIAPHLKIHFVNNNQRPIQVHLSLEEKQEKKGAFFNPASFAIQPDSVDPEMRFDTFVLEKNNEVPSQILHEIEQGLFNPIFLYGPRGVGKTHLLMATAHRLTDLGKKVFFVRASTFTEHVVQAIRLGKMQDFRKIYREIDALIIDGIDLFSNKNATQEEFFHTFNALHTAGKPLLISANVAPSKLQEIEPRLISRFEWGICLPIQRANAKAALKMKIKLWNLSLLEEAETFLLNTFPTSCIMALQALLLRAPKTTTFTQEHVEKLLKDLIQKQQKIQWTTEMITKEVALSFGVTLKDLQSKGQTKQIAIPRKVAMYFCRKTLRMPYQAIGKFFEKDHSTVMSSVKWVEERVLKKDPSLLKLAEKFA